MELYGKEYLKNKLRCRKSRCDLRYKYYEQKNTVVDPNEALPAKLRQVKNVLGWCSKAVDSLADRLSVGEFDNDRLMMWELYKQNNPDVLFDSAIRSALITSCSFLYVFKGEDELVKIRVIDGRRSTGTIDDQTGMMYEGYAVLAANDKGDPLLEAYFTPDRVEYYDKEHDQQPFKVVAMPDDMQYCSLIPIIYKPDSKRPFGHSRISRAAMSTVKSAIMNLHNSEIAAQFYAYPQKYVLGVSDDFEIDRWQASISAMFMATRDSKGDVPVVGSFASASMTPYTDMMRMYAQEFAGETGLTVDDLGFSSDNPSSADAIKAGHDQLRLMGRSAQKTFGSGFINAGYIAACINADRSLTRTEAVDTQILWQPMFEPDASMIASIGDAVYKINQMVPGYIDQTKLKYIIGI